MYLKKKKKEASFTHHQIPATVNRSTWFQGLAANQCHTWLSRTQQRFVKQCYPIKELAHKPFR